MRLLMESAPREHEKRTLSAHLESRSVSTYVGMYSHLCGKQTSQQNSTHLVVLGLISELKLKYSWCLLFSRSYEIKTYIIWLWSFRVQMFSCVSVMSESLRGIIKREVLWMCPHFKCSSSRYNIYITNGREVNNRGILGGKDGESREQTLHKLHVIFYFFCVCTWIYVCIYGMRE